MNQNLKKAILFFSRTAEEEAKYKSFHNQVSFKGNLAIGQGLINASLKTLSEVDIPLICCYSDHQVGDSFGERLSNAIEDVFKNGYEQVVVVGNDCPFINKEHILSSFESINQGQLVIGPSTDGGVYLFGLNKSQFDKNELSKLAWMQSDLLDSFKIYGKQYASEILLLEEQDDVDSINFLSEINTNSFDPVTTTRMHICASEDNNRKSIQSTNKRTINRCKCT